ncbi:hypothetical protein BH18ACT6_BH18ACT6_25200 [soil metagenome]
MIGDVPEGLLSAEQDKALRTATTILLDRFFADVGHLEAGGEFDDTAMAGYLPPIFLPKYTSVFAKQFLICVAMVGWKLAQPEPSRLGCVGEELALRGLIEEAEAILEVGGHDTDLGGFHELAFDDTDFLMLFEPAFDGIEDSDIGTEMGVGHLAFEDWFKPFYQGVAHPYLT